MHSIFLYHAIAAGLDMAIVNPSMLQIYSNIEPELLKCAEDVILNRHTAGEESTPTERLVALAQRIKAAQEVQEVQEVQMQAQLLPLIRRSNSLICC